MKQYSKLSVAVLLFGLVIACNQSDAMMEVSSDASQITSNDEIISSNPEVESKNPNRKFVRTADMKFKVKNVLKSTYSILNVVEKNDGFVIFTDLKSNINDRKTRKISQDSILETIKYTVDNSITFRVPNAVMDSVLREIAKEIDFLDNQTIKADDVSLQLISNKLAQKRLQKSQTRLKKGVDTEGKKLNQIADAEDRILNKQSDSDAHLLNILNLEDQLAFSTITLYLYQRETTKNEIIANDENPNTYRPTIVIQIVDSLKTGWYVLESIIAFMIQLWSIILFSILGYFIYRKYLKK